MNSLIPKFQNLLNYKKLRKHEWRVMLQLVKLKHISLLYIRLALILRDQ